MSEYMVTVYKTVSALFDVIHFCAIYFNRETWIMRNKSFAQRNQNILEYYYEFSWDRPELNPPYEFFLFFYIDMESISPMKAYAQKYLTSNNYELKQIIDFFKDITSFKEFIFYQILEPYQHDIDIEEVIKGNLKNIDNVLMKLKHKKHYTQLFSDFDSIVQDWVLYLEKILPEMESFHESKSHLISDTLKRFYNSENLNIISKLYNLDSDFDFSSYPYIFCYINQFLKSIFYRNSYTDFTFCLGCDFNQYTLQEANYDHINYISVLKLFKDTVIIKILDQLLNGESTVTELVQELDISRGKVNQAVSHLHKELAVVIEYEYGKGIYYSLNYRYWYVVKMVFDNRFSKISKSIKNIFTINKNSINFQALMELLIDPVVNEVVDKLAAGVSTTKIIARKLYMPIEKIEEAIEKLMQEAAVVIINRDMEGIHYRLNPAYFITAKSILYEKINKILDKFNY